MPLRREDRSDSGERTKNSAHQDHFGTVGSEEHVEYIIDPFGKKIFIGGSFKGICFDRNGIPKVISANINSTLNCSHTVSSNRQLKGICCYGHTVCLYCALYTCVLCGSKLCDHDVAWFQDRPVCPCHGKEVLKKQISEGLMIMVTNFVAGLFGYGGQGEFPEYRPGNSRRIEE